MQNPKTLGLHYNAIVLNLSAQDRTPTVILCQHDGWPSHTEYLVARALPSVCVGQKVTSHLSYNTMWRWSGAQVWLLRLPRSGCRWHHAAWNDSGTIKKDNTPQSSYSEECVWKVEHDLLYGTQRVVWSFYYIHYAVQYMNSLETGFTCQKAQFLGSTFVNT